VFRCGEDVSAGPTEPSKQKVILSRSLCLLALCLFVPTSLASAYDDHGKNYRVPATDHKLASGVARAYIGFAQGRPYTAMPYGLMLSPTGSVTGE
jgi:hypothetical protein